MTRIARTLLFVPGNRPERFPKAVASGAHAVIIDLEDAVPPAERDTAREAAAEWLATKGNRAMLRVNGATTEWHRRDLEAAGAAGVTAVVVPKVERLAELHAVRHALPATPILPIVETAHGIRLADEIASFAGVTRLAFGSLDLGIDLGIAGLGAELDYFRSRVVLASRLAGLAPPVGGVVADFRDDDALRADTERERRFGFGGKLCIHPRQIEVVHGCFRPKRDEVAWARRVLEASRKARGRAVQLDGRMIDRPIVIQAETVLADAGLSATRKK
ncbi:MAG: CoA ester lyase [Gemmatimonadales bacterium]